MTRWRERLGGFATVAVTLASLVLAACDADGCFDCGRTRDLWGNALPAECAVADLASKVDIPPDHILVLPEDLFPPPRTLPDGETWYTLGECLFCGVADAVPVIWLSERLRPGEIPGAIQHELCHRRMFLLGRDINWHPVVPGSPG